MRKKVEKKNQKKQQGKVESHSKGEGSDATVVWSLLRGQLGLRLFLKVVLQGSSRRLFNKVVR